MSENTLLGIGDYRALWYYNDIKLCLLISYISDVAPFICLFGKVKGAQSCKEKRMSVAKSIVGLNVSKVAASILATSLLLTACSNGEHHEAVPLSDTLEEAAELAHANAPEPVEYDFEVTEMPATTDTEATAAGTDAEATAAGAQTDNAQTVTTTTDVATTDTASAMTDTATSASTTTASTTSDSAAQAEAVAQ